MIIKNSNSKETIKKTFKNSFVGKYILTKLNFFLFLFLCVLISCFIISKKLQTKGYSGLWDFSATVSSNYFKGLKADPENISIEIKDKDYKFLEKNREKALERGVIINDLDGDYVPATLEYKGKKIKIKLRLKGHMTDHLQDNKWSFRIKVKDKDSFMGMKRFSVQHPGTRGYIYEWIYHELMKREDIIALRYKFINISVNGKDWGIYAVEENFDQELIENNNRKKAPIIRFNPNLYWIDRYNEIEGIKPLAEYASYYSSNVEAYREDKSLEDSTQKLYYLKAIALMEGLRSKKLQVDEVFDIERLAKFHAIIDLVGGQHSIDWSDIKYYYNPVTARLEPVAYESFTVFPFQDISGNYKYVQLDSNVNYEDLHSAIFSDPQFFRAYIKNLERISKPSYLDKFFNDSNDELKNNLAILYKEFPYKKFDKQNYYANQLMIKKIINTPKAFNAYYNNVINNRVHLQLGAIESLPVEVKSVSIGKVLGLPLVPITLPAKQPNQYVNYKDYVFSLPSGLIWNDSLIQLLKVNYAILGASADQETTVYPFPHTDTEYISSDLKNKQGNIASFSFLTVDDATRSIYIKRGKQILDRDLIIPEGYRLMANLDVSIDIKNHAKIISYSAFGFTGTEDEPIIIESSDSTSEGIEIIGAPKSIFNFVTFKNLPKVHDSQWARTGALTFYESQVEFKNCSFYNCKAKDGINLIRSGFSFKECLFNNMSDNALDADFSDGTITNCVFENCKENALDITMSKLKVSDIYVNGVGNKAFNIKGGSQFNGNDIRIKNARIGFSAEGHSTLDLKKIAISDSEIGIVAYQNEPAAGYPVVTITELVFNNTQKEILKEKKSNVTVNGIVIKNEVDNVEILIKGDKKKHK